MFDTRKKKQNYPKLLIPDSFSCTIDCSLLQKKINNYFPIKWVEKKKVWKHSQSICAENESLSVF